MSVTNSMFRNNEASGIEAGQANVEAFDSVFTGNGAGVRSSSGRGTFERCAVIANSNGLNLDAEVFVVRNNFIARNTNKGLEIFPSAPGNIVEFNTIVDNSVGVSCIFSNGLPETPFPNNLIVRNGVNTTGGTICTYPNSIITNVVADVRFVSPDTAPFDYHIQDGSIAIGGAGTTTLMLDFDGDPRPMTGAEVGADELP